MVFILKYRKKILYDRVRREIGPILRDVCNQKGVVVLEGHVMPGHVHMCVSIPPTFSVAQVVGFIKGKSAVRIHRGALGHKKLTGPHFWATGYCVSTAGLNEESIRHSIREQEKLQPGQGGFDFPENN
jgi:putative transposase